MINMLKQSIDRLGLETKLINRLRENNINIVRDLWNTKRNDLKKIGLNDNDINQIMIKMQLQGLDLNKKVYKTK